MHKSIYLAMLLGLGLIAGNAHAQTYGQVTAAWACQDRNASLVEGGNSKIIISVWVYGNSEVGEIKASGITKETHYQQLRTQSPMGF